MSGTGHLNNRRVASETAGAGFPRGSDGVAPRIEWTGERCVPWASDYQMVYEHLHRYHFAASLCNGRRVLDLASGEGYGSAILADVASEVVGVDNDAASVAHAQANYTSERLRFLEGSMLDPAVVEAASFDVVVCLEALEHVEDHDRLLSVIRGALRDDGVLVISTPDRRVYTDRDHNDNPFHVHEVDREELTALLAPRFANVVLWGQVAATGSVMHAFDADRGGTGEVIAVRGDGDGWPRQPSVQTPYLVGVASNADLPTLPSVSTLIDTEMLLARRPAALITGLVEEVAELAETVRLRDGHIEELEVTLRALAARAQSSERQLESITTSKGWRSVVTFRRGVDSVRGNALVTRLRKTRPRS
jgi:O-antigen biosynthesis protein